MRYSLIGVLGVVAMFAACSQSASGSADDDSEIATESSSSIKGKSSSSKDSEKKSSSSEKKTESSSSNNSVDEKLSSSSAFEELEEDCVGEPGNPWDGTTAKDFACGAGTKLSPYIILTAEQLAKLSFVINASDKDYMGKYFKLGADIKLNKGDIIDEKGALVGDSTKLHKWTPIGNSSVAFDGSFDGDDHTVSGMFINTTSNNNGLFGNTSGTIRNVTLDNSWVYGGKYTGGVIGYNVGTVENVTNFASVSGVEDCIGGVLGSSNQRKYQYNSILKKLKNSGVVVGKKNVGGVSGCAAYVNVDGAENTAPIEGYGYVGGVFGGIGNTTKNDVKDMRNSGKITGYHFVGGISGHCGGTSLSINTYQETSSYYCSDATSWSCGKFMRAVNVAAVSGKYYVGGILGVACGGSISELSNTGNVNGVYGTAGVVSSSAFVTSKNMYNKGNVFGELYAGGIFSYNKEGVTNSAFSTGKVDGDSLVGLMIGYNYNSTMADYYYLKQGEQEPFGLNNGGGVATPKSADEMKSEEFAELLGDDFVYDSGLNDGYPVLNWEKE